MTVVTNGSKYVTWWCSKTLVDQRTVTSTSFVNGRLYSDRLCDWIYWVLWLHYAECHAVWHYIDRLQIFLRTLFNTATNAWLQLIGQAPGNCTIRRETVRCERNILTVRSQDLKRLYVRGHTIDIISFIKVKLQNMTKVNHWVGETQGMTKKAKHAVRHDRLKTCSHYTKSNQFQTGLKPNWANSHSMRIDFVHTTNYKPQTTNHNGKTL